MNLTVKALRDLRIRLGVSQSAVARNMEICDSTFSKMEREEENMPEEIHAGYERFLFDVLNGKRELNNKTQNRVWVYAKAQNSSSKRENEELRKARIQIKEYEALLGMYRKESTHGI